MIQKELKSSISVAQRVCLSLIAVLIALPAGPSGAQGVMGARELGMGQATAALPGSRWAVFSNPAMADTATRTASFYGVRYFGLSELSDMAAAVSVPSPAGVWAFGLHRYGDELFSENRIRLGYANHFDGFHYGIAFSYMHLRQGGGYGSLAAMGIDLGIAAALMPGLWIGSRATNINRPRYGIYSVGIAEEPPRELSVGLAYELSGRALFTADVVKDVRFPFAVRAGTEVQLTEQLQGRTGITTAPVTFAAGFGWNTARWGANVGMQWHEDPVLGTSPAVDFYLLW